MLETIWFALFIPLAGFLFLLAASDVIGRRLTGYIGCSTIFLSFISFAYLFVNYNRLDLSPQDLTLFSWIHVQAVNADFAVHLDPLSLLMTLIITGVGFLIHVYSVGYMEHDEDFARYFACMNFFVFAMLLLVLASNLLLLFVGWEGVGLASYLLIGYYYHRPKAAQAATKAFVVNRIGDWGFLLSLLLTFFLFGTSDIAQISQRVLQEYPVGAPVITLLTLLYFCGAVGKSAQLPLHTWLPDAMEGPTPVSALIHAATMVTAGVYLVVRLHVLFSHAPITLYVVGAIGGATALFAALCALGQTDLKRVLAYSTVSQLGYMFLACGVGAYYAAMFHLTMHAFVKALLFLAAGNVVHMMQGTTDMGKMGGLASRLKKTNALFLIGVLSLSGVPPFAAFFSKDLILEQDYLTGYYTFFYVGMITAVLTAFYLIRAYSLTFLGAPHLDGKIIKLIKEAPKVMLWPVAILAFLAIFGGFLGFSFQQTSWLETFLAKVDVTMAVHESGVEFFLMPETWISITGALLGVFSAWIIYTKYPDRIGKTIAVLKKSFYIDEIYETLFVLPLKAISRYISSYFEPKVFDGTIGTAMLGTQAMAGWLQQMQSGQIRSYVAWMAIGMVLLIVYLIF